MRSLKQTLPSFATLAGLLIVILTATLAAPGARAQQTGLLCDARTSVLTLLKGQYAEKPSAMGLASNGTVLEVLNSEDGTWTILVTAPNGVSCMMATGKHWQEVVTKAKGTPL